MRKKVQVRLLVGLILMLTNAPHVPAQVTVVHDESYKPHLAFDVASIREEREQDGSSIHNPSKSSVWIAHGLTVWGLILSAYNIDATHPLTGLPAWGNTTRYDVSAKSDDATEALLAKLSTADFDAEKRYMLQSLLAERFHLKIHSERRMSVIYELLTTARTAKLMTSVSEDVGKTVSTCGPHYTPMRGTEVDSKGCPFSIFLSSLRQSINADVFDKSGMTGPYAYHLMWGPPPDVNKGEGDWYPSLVNAVGEQLGLELKKAKGLSTFWVVDSVEQPTPN